MPFTPATFHLSETTPSGVTGTAGKSSSVRWFKYVTPDTVASMIGAAYFNNARDQIAAGDVVSVVAEFGTAAPKTDILVFQTVPTTGNVTVARETDV